MEDNKEISKNIYLKTFLWMFLGLFATGLISVFAYTTNVLPTLILSGIWPILLIAEIVVVLLFSFLFRKLPPSVVLILFFIYAVINGVSISSIFYVFKLSSIIYLFFVASAVFGICVLYGYFTKKDLSKIGPILTITLIACLVISIVNLFLNVTLLDTIIDCVVLLLFFGMKMLLKKLKIK